jgi:hypothetical protein
MPQALEAKRYPPRTVAGVAAMCLLSIWGALQYYSAEAAYQRENRDPYMIAEQMTRFAPLAAVVPAGAVLGYLTDAEPGSVADSTLFTSATYALAPRLVERGVAHDFVLGNFTRPSDFAAIGRSSGLRLEQDFGNGVVLFKKEHQP